MILRNILPPAGGSLRRYLNLKKDYISRTILEKRSSKFAFSQPVTLIDFRRRDDLADALSEPRNSSDTWRLSDDETIGGFSRGMMTVMKTKEKSHDEGEKDSPWDAGILPSDDESSSSSSSSSSVATTTPYIRWNGTINTKIPSSSQRTITRSGFCYLRSPEFKFNAAYFKRKTYNALEITCRTDGRFYNLNLKVETYWPDDLYQGFIKTPPSGDFVKLVMPFRDFTLTKVGSEREMQRRLDGDVNIEHVALMLADGVDGDFQFDLASVRVVNYIGGDVVEEGIDEDEDSLDFRRRRGW